MSINISSGYTIHEVVNLSNITNNTAAAAANSTAALLCNFNETDCQFGLSDFQSSYIRMHGYLATLVCIVGVLGNLANIVVLSRPTMAASPINFHLMIIAIADLMLMLVYLPLSFSHYILADPNLAPLVTESRNLARYLYFQSTSTIFFHSTAIWHTIAVATFRLIFLGTTNGKIYCTKKNAIICSIILICVNLLMSVPNWITNTVFVMNATDCHHPRVLYTVMARPDSKFNNWLYACFGKIIPCILLTYLTIPLLYIMRKAEQRRRNLLSKGKNEESRRHQEHNRTTGMLLAVVMIFLFIELPHGVLIICLRYKPELYTFYDSVGEVIDLTTLIAFSITFILYTIMSRQFRTTFLSLFCKQASKIPQSATFRRLSSMVTNGRLSIATTANGKSHLQSNNSSAAENGAAEQLHDQRYLSPARPLLDDSTCSSNTMETSITLKEDHSRNGERAGMMEI